MKILFFETAVFLNIALSSSFQHCELRTYNKKFSVLHLVWMNLQPLHWMMELKCERLLLLVFMGHLRLVNNRILIE